MGIFDNFLSSKKKKSVQEQDLSTSDSYVAETPGNEQFIDEISVKPEKKGRLCPSIPLEKLRRDQAVVATISGPRSEKAKYSCDLTRSQKLRSMSKQLRDNVQPLSQHADSSSILTFDLGNNKNFPDDRSLATFRSKRSVISFDTITGPTHANTNNYPSYSPDRRREFNLEQIPHYLSSKRDKFMLDSVPFLPADNDFANCDSDRSSNTSCSKYSDSNIKAH